MVVILSPDMIGTKNLSWLAVMHNGLLRKGRAELTEQERFIRDVPISGGTRSE